VIRDWLIVVLDFVLKASRCLSETECLVSLKSAEIVMSIESFTALIVHWSIVYVRPLP